MPRILNSLPTTPVALAGFVSIAACASCFAQGQLEPQVTPQMRREAVAIMQACRADYDRICGNVQPGGGRILACLHLHSSELSPGCAQAIPDAEKLRDRAIAIGAMPK